MAAIETQGTRFFWSTSTALSTAVEILGVKNFSGLSGQSPIIDVTDLQSTIREQKIGLRSPGELTLGLVWDPATTEMDGQRALEADAGTRTLRKLAIKWSTIDTNGLGLEVDAYCGGITIDGSEDDVLSGSAQIILNAGVTHTTFAT